MRGKMASKKESCANMIPLMVFYNFDKCIKIPTSF